MTNDQVGEVEAIVNSIVATNSPIFAKELSLAFTKVAHGVRTCTEEVSDVYFSAGGCSIVTTIVGKMTISSGGSRGDSLVRTNPPFW